METFRDQNDSHKFKRKFLFCTLPSKLIGIKMKKKKRKLLGF